MTLIGARQWRIEVRDNFVGGPYCVFVTPVAHIGREEFKDIAREFRRLFMDLERTWCWSRKFSTREDASAFAKGLAKYLGELAYVDLKELRLVAPKEIVETSGASP